MPQFRMQDNRPYVFAAGCAVLALSIRWLLDPKLGAGTLVLPSLLGLFLTAAFARFRPAVLAFVLCGIAYPFVIPWSEAREELLPFAVLGPAILFLAHAARGSSTGPVSDEESSSDAVRVASEPIKRLSESEAPDAALKKSEARFRLLADSMPQIVWSAGPGGEVAFLNQRWTEYTGIRPGSPWTAADVIHPDDLMPSDEAWTESLRTGQPFSFELRLRPAGGKDYRWFLSRAVLVPGLDGEPSEWFGTSTDIHDLKSADGVLRRAQAMFQLVLDNIPQGVFWKDRQSRYLGCNLVVARAMGLRETSEIAGVSDAEFPSFSPEQAAFFVEKDRLVMESGTPQLHIQEPMTLADGSTVWLDTNKVPLHDERGRVIGILGTWEDITERRRTEGILRTNEERIRLATETAGMGTWERDLKTGKLHWSAALERMMGFEPGVFPGTFDAFVALIHPDDRAKLDAARKATFEEGKPYQVELRFVLADGAARWGLVRGQLLRNASGVPERLLGVQMDITERKRAEEEFRRMDRFREILIQSAAEGICVCHAVEGPPHIRFSTWNDEMASITGFTMEEINRLGWFKTVYPNEQSRSRAMARAALLWEGEDLRGEEWEITRKDGERRMLAFSTSGIRGEDGVAGTVVFAQDVTERHRAEALRLALAGAEIGTWNWDAVKDVWVLSKLCRRIFGLPVEGGAGFTGFLDSLEPDDRRRAREALKRSLDTQCDFEIEFRTMRPDGPHWAIARGRGRYDAAGRLLRMEGAAMDITNRKRTEEEIRALNWTLERQTGELREANKELEAFSYSVSHDLRAPLRAIDGFSRIVVEDHSADLPTTALEFLQLIRHNTRRMSRLIDDLLAFSHLGRRALHRQTADTLALVRECAEHEMAGLQVDFRVGDLPRCEADPALLRQVWANLLSNAVKYSGTRADPSVEAGCVNGVYYVRDNGVGFDMRYSHKLFAVFQRLHKPEEFEGNGIGLATVRRIVQRHGGKVWAEAKPGEGATFYFTIPPDDSDRRE